MEGAEVVRRYWVDLWGSADLDLVDELFAEPFVRHNRNGTITLSHKDLKLDFVRYWRTLRAARVTIEDQVESGDRVWTRVDIRGVNLETGDQMVVNFIQVVRLVDGRMAEAWSLNATDVDWRRSD